MCKVILFLILASPYLPKDGSCIMMMSHFHEHVFVCVVVVHTFAIHFMIVQYKVENISLVVLRKITSE